jgi:NAD(P)-dependent dehydrogenase (short-subunit alcohol dehydrogenase family)
MLARAGKENRPIFATCSHFVRWLGAIQAFDVIALVAGIQGFKPIVEMDDPDWNDHININLTGTANCLRSFAPAMLKRGQGRIILTSSTQGRHGTLNGAAYSASKWGCSA